MDEIGKYLNFNKILLYGTSDSDWVKRVIDGSGCNGHDDTSTIYIYRTIFGGEIRQSDMNLIRTIRNRKLERLYARDKLEWRIFT